MIGLYDKLGGDAGIRKLVDVFYDNMTSFPEAESILKLHPEDLTESRDKLYEFLVGWSGGPPLYVQKHGHPRLRMRHMPFPIGEAERDAWLSCMRKAFVTCGISDEISTFLDEKFTNIADFMRNKDG